MSAHEDGQRVERSGSLHPEEFAAIMGRCCAEHVKALEVDVCRVGDLIPDRLHERSEGVPITEPSERRERRRTAPKQRPKWAER